MFIARDGALLRTCCGERLLVEPWGTDALRVRSTMHADFDRENWALDAERPPGAAEIHIAEGDKSASIRNGDILARIDPRGQISYYNAAGDLLLSLCAINLPSASIWAWQVLPGGPATSAASTVALIPIHHFANAWCVGSS